MNKTYIAIIILVLVVGGLFMLGKGKKLEAPTTVNDNTTVIDEKMLLTLPVIPNGVVKEFTIVGDNFSFSPSTITVNKGDKVKITFKNSKGFHDFVIDEFGAATKQINAPTTEILEFTADKVGSFEYYCSVGTHRAMGMLGTLIVQE